MRASNSLVLIIGGLTGFAFFTMGLSYFVRFSPPAFAFLLSFGSATIGFIGSITLLANGEHTGLDILDFLPSAVTVKLKRGAWEIEITSPADKVQQAVESVIAGMASKEHVAISSSEVGGEEVDEKRFWREKR